MNKLALSTAVLALVSGAAFAQTTAPTTGTGSEPTTGTGMEPAPLTGNVDAPPRDAGDEGGVPAIDAMPGSDAPETTTPPAEMTPPATSTMPGDMTEGPMMTPPEGYASVEASSLTGEVLNGATVYGRDEDEATEDNNIGKISSVVPAEGAPQQVIVDVGGFLGIGAKSVALTVSELSFFQEVDGETVRAYTTMTEDELKALPEYTM